MVPGMICAPALLTWQSVQLRLACPPVSAKGWSKLEPVKVCRLWQLLHSPLTSCGGVWQVEQVLGAIDPLWHCRHDAMAAGSW